MAADGPERYRAIVDADGNPKVYHETVQVVSSEDAERFRQFSSDLELYEELYWQAIAESGFDATQFRTQLQAKSQGPDFSVIPKMSEAVAEYYAGRQTTDTMGRMNARGGLLADDLHTPEFFVVGETPPEDIRGLQYRIRRYFSVLLVNGTKRGYQRS